ncbi:hypothetical protein BVC80_1727g19 [Macleaya cordata]|uniref:Uncharacterized protein n=1 Tax=Macleaya cordata TaxID=56857 RepID=A0A200QXD4_MACCD|nr:hypothetical protein BVC80_1727g19 [Macleaya cordata]
MWIRSSKQSLPLITWIITFPPFANVSDTVSLSTDRDVADPNLDLFNLLLELTEIYPLGEFRSVPLEETFIPLGHNNFDDESINDILRIISHPSDL